MKNKFKSIICLMGTLIFSSCSCTSSNYNDKKIEEMNIMELNQYNEDLKEEKLKLENYYNKLYELSDGKTKEEILEMINYVNKEVIKSNVMIANESKSFFNSTNVSSGSGTIIKEDETYYYVLTNNHVIYSLGNKTSYYVYDYLNNEYNATILFSNPNYDMALLKFNKTSTKLRVVTLANEDLEVNKNVIAIGQPGGQRNAITFGEVLRYEKVLCTDCRKDESNIDYDCMYYNAPTSNGNSGGMVLDYNYQLVAVVTYGMNSYSGNYMYGAGSPISKVREFLAENNFEVGDNNA